MTEYATIRSNATMMEPTTPSRAQVGSIFIDSTNSNALSFKNISGLVSVIGSVSSDNVLVKSKKNNTGSTIANRTPVALLTDGSISPADSDGLNIQVVIGVTIEEITSGSYGKVMLNGPNAAGALTGLGFAPGDAIMLSATPGQLTNTQVGMDPLTQTIMKVGVADCASGAQSSNATDLIMEAEVISRPSGEA